MLRALRFLKDFWYLPVMAVVAIAGWLAWRRWSSRSELPPFQKILDEVAAIESGREAREVQLQQGAEVARTHVHEKYAETLKRLDAEAKAKVQELEHDPAALANCLDRLAER